MCVNADSLRQEDCTTTLNISMMHHETPRPRDDNKTGEKSEKVYQTVSENDNDPESDTPADVTPRNIDPSDENSAEPDITEETERNG